MVNKIKQNLAYVLCAAIGLLTFLFSAFSFAKAEGIIKFNGYDLLDEMWGFFGDELFAAKMATIVEVLILIVGALVCAYGVCGILKAIGKFEKFPEAICSVKTNKLASIMLWVMAGLYALELLFLIITLADEYMDGIKLGAGIFIALIFAIAAVVADSILGKKFAVVEEAAEESADAE